MSDFDEREEENRESLDPFLKLIVETVETLDGWSNGAQLSVTVSVRGAIMTGMAIAERDYLEALGERWRQAFAGSEALSPLADRIDGAFQELAKRLPDKRTAWAAPSDFLHLREAYLVTAAGVLPTETLEGQPLLLRIPLARVDSFTLGRLRAAPA